jgi:hypothetical protein
VRPWAFSVAASRQSRARPSPAVAAMIPSRRLIRTAARSDQRRQKTDVYILDSTRTGKWQISYWDVDFDDTFALKGIHVNGEMKPVRFEKRCPGKAGKDFRCL